MILVDHAVSPRLPGQSSSGSITLPKAQLIEQQLEQAGSLANGGEPVQALKLYQRVLSEDPNDPNALSAAGWLEWNYGTAGHNPTLQQVGRRNEEKAIKVAPTLYAGHFFLGLILYNQDDNAKAAVVQFNSFLADHPPAAEVTSVAKLAAGRLPAGRCGRAQPICCCGGLRPQPRRLRNPSTTAGKASTKAAMSSSVVDHPTERRNE